MQANYMLRAKRYSHWVLSDEGDYIHLSKAKLAVCDGWYYSDERIDVSATAIVVMDPWIDWPDENLNRYYGDVTKEKLLPLVKAAVGAGHRVIILTEAPSRAYNTQIDKELQKIVENREAEIIYHQHYTTEGFYLYLKNLNVDTLIYTGYASNLCVLSRDMGIVPMSKTGLRLFFVPEASAGMERADTWDSGLVHEVISLVISQATAKLLDCRELTKALASL